MHVGQGEEGSVTEKGLSLPVGELLTVEHEMWKSCQFNVCDMKIPHISNGVFKFENGFELRRKEKMVLRQLWYSE